jgi:hypothetical protein
MVKLRYEEAISTRHPAAETLTLGERRDEARQRGGGRRSEERGAEMKREMRAESETRGEK